MTVFKIIWYLVAAFCWLYFSWLLYQRSHENLLDWMAILGCIGTAMWDLDKTIDEWKS